MQPPETMNIMDQHGGFTAITKSKTYIKIIKDPIVGEREAVLADYQPTLIHPFVRWDRVMRECNTLWRPGPMPFGRSPIGTLDAFDENSFYQNNNNVTKAYYRVKGYRFRIAVWFDNETGKRIA